MLNISRRICAALFAAVLAVAPMAPAYAADLTITAASVVPQGNAIKELGIAGATITAGQVVYKEAATSQFKLADSNSGTAEAKHPYGIALGGASANQSIVVQRAGDVVIGATLVAGATYWLSETPGGIQPVADLGSTENVALLGIAKSTTVLMLTIIEPGVTL